ncbi:hypothetical protein [Paraburkholderia rhizosphaerae]|uniref:Lipoprotein n=1 Tax=Paraburkholderia rhizosphaerae TaxID=480658 RepID=A0A4R8L516_9BURK|nr:hypothetical protein [Paraburkholderia rhizosphaerae]TDY37395.1 hypothetical protein BX592_13838 [Paraburkholderia rhizosphaerae]
MHKIALLAVAVSVLLSGCERRIEEIKDCIAGKTQPVDVDQAVKIVKAAGFEVRRPDSIMTPAPSSSAASASSSTSSLPKQASTHQPFSLLCNTTVQGQPVSQSLTVDLDAATVNGVRADVSETEIKWTTQSRDHTGAAFTGQIHTLNRLNGNYRFHDEGAVYAAPVPSYRCALASKRLF